MRVVIIEDENLAARNLQTIIEGLGRNLRVVAVIDSIAETVEWFSYNREPDILFMDINLADGSAFEVFNRVKINCPVIFTTGYDAYALKAFKVNSVDYLLKPVEPNDVRKALEKLEFLSSHGNFNSAIQALTESLTAAQSYRTHFLVSVRGDKLIPLKAEDIAFFSPKQAL